MYVHIAYTTCVVFAAIHQQHIVQHRVQACSDRCTRPGTGSVQRTGRGKSVKQNVALPLRSNISLSGLYNPYSSNKNDAKASPDLRGNSTHTVNPLSILP